MTQRFTPYECRLARELICPRCRAEMREWKGDYTAAECHKCHTVYILRESSKPKQSLPPRPWWDAY